MSVARQKRILKETSYLAVGRLAFQCVSDIKGKRGRVGAEELRNPGQAR